MGGTTQTTSLNLTKGEKVDLTKGNAGLTKVIVGLGWDARDGSGNAFDLDAFAFVLKGGKLYQGERSVIYFGHKDALGIHHCGDNLTGAGEGDDEQIKIDLSAIPADADEVMLAVNIYEAANRNERFGQVKNAFIRLLNEADSSQLLKYDLTEDYSSNTGVLMGKLYRHNGEWKFEAIGQGVNGDINEIVRPYHS